MLIALFLGSSLLGGMGGNNVPYHPLMSVAPPEPHRSLNVVPLTADKRYYGEAPVGLAGRSGAGFEE